jgi:cell division protein FtsW (lipid II flippase)
MERVDKHRSDFLWYVLTGLLVLFAIGIFVVYVPEGKRPDRKWTEFFLYSSFLFIFLAKFYWRIRRQFKMWLIMLAALVLHLSVYVPLLSRIEHWPSLAYLLLMPIEGMLIVLVLKLALGVLPNPNVRL